MTFSGDIPLELVCLSHHNLNWISVQLFLSDSSFWEGYDMILRNSF